MITSKIHFIHKIPQKKKKDENCFVFGNELSSLEAVTKA